MEGNGNPLPKPIREDGFEWYGTRAELDAWKRYKADKALAFVRRGYSVEWYPDADGWMDVYTPQRDNVKAPEIRASVKFYSEPSQFGIDRGRVSKLAITETWVDLLAEVMGRPHERSKVIYNYDRGPDVDKLRRHSGARRLYDDVLAELN